MHADGSNGFGLNMITKLFDYLKFKIIYNFTNDYAVTAKPFYQYHCGLLVSDNVNVFRYYWSIREDELILEECKPIRANRGTKYYFADSDVDIKHGMRISKAAA